MSRYFALLTSLFAVVGLGLVMGCDAGPWDAPPPVLGPCTRVPEGGPLGPPNDFRAGAAAPPDGPTAR